MNFYLESYVVFSSVITNSKNAVSLKLLRGQYFVPENVSNLTEDRMKR